VVKPIDCHIDNLWFYFHLGLYQAKWVSGMVFGQNKSSIL